VGKYTFYHDFSAEKKLGILIGRLARFARNYAKKAMQDLPIATLDEFTYLVGISGEYTPSKSELINAHYMEMTSGSEIIRRLVKMGLVEEITDAADKRLKRLRITSEGERVRARAIEQMGEVARLVAGNLTDDEKTQAVTLLTQLDSFHVEVNGRDTDATLAELIGRYIIGRS
jgi:DNA-binding MarR family transcriptional regulator